MIETRGAAGVPERFAIGACRDRWLEFLELEHAVLPAPVEVERAGKELLVGRGRLAARPIAQGRIPQPWRAPLLLQAASAAAFFASRGFALTPADLDAAAWDTACGSARLWLTRTPASLREGGTTPVVDALGPLLERLFSRGGRLSLPAARGLGEEMSAPEAALKRGEVWVARVLRAFPELAGPGAAAARQRCLGVGSEALGGARARALGERTRALLREREPRLFEPPSSALTPGGALGLDPPPDGVGDACRRLREHARAAVGPVWIAVEPERWDSLSLRAFDAARLALGNAVEVVEVRAAGGLPETPADWRRALWVPCGTVAASVRFYEWFADLVRPDPAAARARMRRILGSPGWAEFVADPTGDAPLPHAAEAGNSSPPRVRAPDGDPGERIDGLLAAGKVEPALSEAEKWIREFPHRRAEAWFSLSARLAAVVPAAAAPWLDALEAEREIAGGRPRDALARLERLGRPGGGSPPERRRARLRAAEVTVMLGHHAEAARRAAAWRREHADAPASESVRALRLGASGLSREGRTDCALALLDEADRLGADASELERLETGLARARVFALSARYAEEDAVYQTLRPLALGAADERLAIRFLAQEARALLDRRQYEQATVRLEEALGVAADDPGERAELLLDLAATIYHAGDEARCESLLEESLRAAAAAGREDLAQIARGNRVELLINRCAWETAAREIAQLETRASPGRDDPRRLIALHHRGRLALRRGRLEEAARANADARALAERLGDRLEIGELWLEEGDRLLYERDLLGARGAWERAAADPPDRCRRDRTARERLEELAWRDRGGLPETACGVLEERFAADPYGAAESLARWTCLFGETGVPADARERAQRVLRAAGGQALADRVFGPVAESLPAQTVREIRDAVSAALAGEDPPTEGMLRRLGLAGLAVRDEERRELVRLGAIAAPAETVWRTLQAGGARFELALWPELSGPAAAAVALVLETLLFRSVAEPAAAHFAEGWVRLGIVTADASMEEPYRRLTRFAPQSVTALILGESGSGKEAVARAIHRLSARSAGPFVPVNVPAIPPALLESELFGHARGAFTGADRDRRGLLEEASGGTIFFDEIGDLAPPLQAKLLRALQEREIRRVGENRARTVDVRVVSATSRNLERAVEAGDFREDLYYRLHVAVIRLPPLRERGRDAILLARHFLEHASREYGRGTLRLAPEAAAAIGAYAWPGNVRELQNAMAQAAALGDTDGDVTVSLLPEATHPARPHGVPAGDYRARVDAHRRDLISDALGKAGGNRSRAARDLGLSRQALHYLMRELKVAVKPANGKR